MDALNLLELEALARTKLDPVVFDYFVSGAHDELTLKANREAYQRVELHYRVLVDVSRRDTSINLLGQKLSLPVLVAPTAFHKLAHPDGELATARAAAAQGTAMVLSSLSNTAVEEVVRAAAGSPVWFQLYVYRDREVTRALVARAEAAGCRALVLTVDAPLLGTRERDVRNRFALPPHLSVENLTPAGFGRVARPENDSGLASYVSALLDPALSWKDVEWLRSITRLPVWIKGVVRADDARRALDHGASGVVVSNHGGRQLDGAPATLDVLPRIADALSGRLPLLVDGGVRRGSDVLKALALGAKAVLLGRPVLWGLALEGQTGVEWVLATLRKEIDLAMALCGCPTVTEVDRSLVRPADDDERSDD